MNSTVLAVLKAITVVSSIGLLLSLIPTYRKIVRAKTTGDFSILPAATLWFSCSLWSLYGCLVNNFVPVVAVDSFGTLLGILFTVIFFKYAKDRARARKICLILGTIELLVVVYVVLGVAGVTNQTRNQVSTALGFVTAGTDLVLYSSPLATLRHVLKVEDASSIPLTMSIVAFFNTALWVIISTDDLFLAIPNGIGCAFSVVGIVVYFMYPPREASPANEVEANKEVALNQSSVHPSPCNYDEVRTPVPSAHQQHLHGVV